MSGIDERPIFKIIWERFVKICPGCENVRTIYFKFNNAMSYPAHSYFGRIGYLSWRESRVKPYAYLSDFRATYDSVEKHQVMCSCGYNFSNKPKIRMGLINLFRGNVEMPFWERQEGERLRNERNR